MAHSNHLKGRRSLQIDVLKTSMNYALAYFCLKLVNYSFFFWLPYYLHASFGWSESTADKISIWYDIGGIVGRTIAGVVSDWFQLRSIVVVPVLILSIPSLLGYSSKQGPIQGNKQALATVTGIVDGTGSVGAALGQTVLTMHPAHVFPRGPLIYQQGEAVFPEIHIQLVLWDTSEEYPRIRGFGKLGH